MYMYHSQKLWCTICPTFDAMIHHFLRTLDDWTWGGSSEILTIALWFSKICVIMCWYILTGMLGKSQTCYLRKQIKIALPGLEMYELCNFTVFIFATSFFITYFFAHLCLVSCSVLNRGYSITLGTKRTSDLRSWDRWVMITWNVNNLVFYPENAVLYVPFAFIIVHDEKT